MQETHQPVDDTRGGRQRLPGERWCPKCEGRTFVLDEETNLAHPCECRADQLKIRRFARARTSLPRLFLEHGADVEREPILSSPHRTVIQDFARNIDRNVAAGSGLWFYGPNGTFKTCAAVAIAREAERRGHAVGFRTVPEILARLRLTHSDVPDGDDFTAYVDKLVGLDLLVLDDFGAERATEYALEALFILINGRMLEKRSTLITSNFEPDDMSKAVGERIVSRLYGLCGKPIHFTGPDARRQVAEFTVSRTAATEDSSNA